VFGIGGYYVEVFDAAVEKEDDELMECDLVSKNSHSLNEDDAGASASAGGNVVKTTLSKDDGKGKRHIFQRKY